MIHISSALGDRTYCGLAFDPSIKRVRKLRGATCQDCIYIWKSGRDVVRAKPRLVCMSTEELEKLPEYSRSVPTFSKLGGELLGVRRWRRKIDSDSSEHAGWWIGEAFVGEGSYITIKWSKVVNMNSEAKQLIAAALELKRINDEIARLQDDRRKLVEGRQSAEESFKKEAALGRFKQRIAYPIDGWTILATWSSEELDKGGLIRRQKETVEIQILNDKGETL